MSKGTTNIKAKQIRFYFANDNGDEYLVQCKVSRWERDDPFGRLPEIVTEVEIERAEDEHGCDFAPSDFSKYEIEDIEYMASEHACYDTAIPRFFSNELAEAEMYAKEMARQLEQAEYAFDEAQARYKDARRRQADATKEVARIKQIQKSPTI